MNTGRRNVEKVEMAVVMFGGLITVNSAEGTLVVELCLPRFQFAQQPKPLNARSLE